MKTAIFAIIFFVPIIALSSCGDGIPPGGKTVILGDKKFHIEDNSGVIYYKKENVIRFLFDVENHKIDNSGVKSLKDRIRTTGVDIANRHQKVYGDRGLWTDTIDPKNLSDCQEHNKDNKKFSMCSYNNEAKPITSQKKSTYVITQNNNLKPITTIGCSENINLPNPQCEAKSVILNDVFVRYMYNIKHLNNTFEINSEILQIILDMHKNLKEI